jgi:hypothetical protein
MREFFWPIGLVVAAFLAIGPAALAACGNGNVEAGEDCDDGSGQNGGTNSCCTSGCKFAAKSPDVIVGMIYGSSGTGGDLNNWGSQGGITAFSMGTMSCNVGSCWLNWFQGTAEHPVIGQNMFRLKDGRFEQIGQSWLKHGFQALAQNLCGACVDPLDSSHLGVNCSDPYSPTFNANQAKLGPKFEVNPSTGVFPYPFGGGSGSGAVYKRLQVHDTDLSPAQNAGALYFVEAQYVTHDDATAGNDDNNASYRSASVSLDSGAYKVTLLASTVQGSPAIKAWQDTDSSVTEATIPAGDGIFILSAKATALGAGIYHYEYALQNLNSNRAGQSFSVPIPQGAVITNVGFHDVDYHSGEPYAGTDWTPTVLANSITWETQTYATNQNANALRWGTLYNFRFDANVSPKTAPATIGLFKPGVPGSLQVNTVTPDGCTAAPGEVASVTLEHDGVTATITWTPALGASSYSVLRGELDGLPVGPGGGDEICLDDDQAGVSVTDSNDPGPGQAFWYLVRGANACGTGSYGAGQQSATCP